MGKCLRCGTENGVPGLDSERCGSCAPEPRPDCGEPDNAPCACYISLDGMSLADLKATFALGDLSLEVDGEGAS